jgi:pseudaminic acid synthase
MTPFIVAEMSANHLGSLKRALDIVEAAADAGADGLKVQTWTPGRMCVDKSYTLDHGPWAGRRLYDLYEEAFLPWEWHHDVFAKARKLGLVPFSAAFDWEAVDFLETLGVDRHKVASFELTDIPLIRYMASKGKPMILSTGMATHNEVMDAIRAVAWAYAERVFTYGSAVHYPITILKCASSYPAPPESMNLRTMGDWTGVGLSDHTMTNEAAVVATALGASMIEKHLTLSRKDGGPDAGFSLEPNEFRDMVQAVRRASLTLGEVKYGPQPGEDTTLRRSLWVAKDISEGEPLLFNENVATARPALGLPPSTQILGKRASRDLKAGTPLKQEDIS